MHPQLWTIPILGLPIYAYGFMVMLGFLMAIFVATRRARRENINPEIILDVGIVVMISGIIGARLAYLIIFADFFKDSWPIFNVFDGNLNTLGGIMGWFIPYIVFYLRRRRTRQPKPIAQQLSKKDHPETLRSVQSDKSERVKMIEKRSHPILTFGILFLISLVSAVIMARVVHLVIHHKDYKFTIFHIWEGGLVFYGGLILAIAVGICYVYRRKLSVLQLGDIVAPCIALGLALGRIGCFLNGCCFGILAHESKVAVEFPKFTKMVPDPKTGELVERIVGSPAFQHHSLSPADGGLGLITRHADFSLPVLPTQLYSSFVALCIFVILSVIWARRKVRGVVLAYFVLFYAVGRFSLEFLRGDNDRILLGLTASQIISVIGFIIALGFLFHLLRKGKEMVDNEVSPH